MVVKRPPMGWNSWNTFGPNINESLIKETADALVNTGLRDAGYEYLVIDDCWAERERDPVTKKIVPSKEKFPNGMKSVSDYVHSKGLKFGMYSCAGVRTCAGYPGSFDHEYLDAETFAEFGVDFLKYDFCNRPQHMNGPLLYRRMGLALKACGRDILFSACNWGCDDVDHWIRSVGAHMYRSTGDIHDNFEWFRDIATSQINDLPLSAPGCYNDIDMLTVGMYGKGLVGSTGCSDTEYKMQIALWCMMSAPLMIGSDIRNLSDEALKLLTNKELLKIDQDEEARPPMVQLTKLDQDETSTPLIKSPKEGGMILFKHLADGEFALGFFNSSDAKWVSLDFYFGEAGIPANSGFGLMLTDIFTGECIGVKNEIMSCTLLERECRIFRAKLVKA